MSRFQIYLYETPSGERLVEDGLALIEAREKRAWDAIYAGIEMLRSRGADAGLNRFKRLRHVAGEELWELRVQSRPAYRLLFSPVPGEEAFVILLVVRKDDMARNPHRYTQRAATLLQQWLER